MIPEFPHDIRIRLTRLEFFLLRPDVAKSLPCWLSETANRAETEQSQDATFFFNWANLILML